ncbi:MAG: tetratricopeptide repeat protein [Acidobacteriota bacterium]|nr:tetratricopeptide repeat protein [Acidobacteriota bacterium]
MRILSLFLTVVLAVSVSAQTPLVSQTFDEGTRMARAGNYENAIENYRRAILLAKAETVTDDFLAKVHFNIGVCLYNLKQTAQAVEKFTEATKLSRRNYQKAFYALGMAHSELKNRRQAADAFHKAVDLNKKDGEAWFDLGLVLLEEKNFESAEKAFRNAVKFKSIAAADAHNNLGVILALKNDLLSAENEFNTALLESNGRSVEARNNLQFCKLYKRNFQNLMAALQFTKNREKARKI